MLFAGSSPPVFRDPLPREVTEAALFIRDTDQGAILRFCDRQLSGLEKLVLESEPPQVTWEGQIRPAIRHASGKLKTVALPQLPRYHGIGGQRRMCQFDNGFPITGDLSQIDVFPDSEKKVPSRISCSELSHSASPRFRERVAKSGKKNALQLRTEAECQVEKGWLAPPVPLHTDGRPHSWKLKGFNLAFRFGVKQAENLRACDDWKHSMTNLACSVHTPIKLVSWDHIAQISHLISEGKLELGMVKADHEAAYKQLPIDPDDQALTIIALRCPTDNKWYGFVTRTLVFGVVAAVLRYNVFPRAVSCGICRVFGIPTGCFLTIFLIWSD